MPDELTMSPGTRYFARMCCILASLTTWHVGGSNAPIRSSVFSERYSCHKQS
jgi:hypothetical protein